MSWSGVGIQLFSVCMCLCQVVAEHPCGENPLRRFASLTRILNDLYPGRDINSAMTLLRDSNSELHRRLLPVVTRLESEWRLYTDCVTMVDNGYFKRSGLPSPSENEGEMVVMLPNKRHGNLLGNVPWSQDASSKTRLTDVLVGAFTPDQVESMKQSTLTKISFMGLPGHFHARGIKHADRLAGIATVGIFHNSSDWIAFFRLYLMIDHETKMHRT